MNRLELTDLSERRPPATSCASWLTWTRVERLNVVRILPNYSRLIFLVISGLQRMRIELGRMQRSIFAIAILAISDLAISGLAVSGLAVSDLVISELVISGLAISSLAISALAISALATGEQRLRITGSCAI